MLDFFADGVSALAAVRTKPPDLVILVVLVILMPLVPLVLLLGTVEQLLARPG